MKVKALANINGPHGDRVKGETFDLPDSAFAGLKARGLVDAIAQPAPTEQPAEAPAAVPAKGKRAARKA